MAFLWSELRARLIGDDKMLALVETCYGSEEGPERDIIVQESTSQLDYLRPELAYTPPNPAPGGGLPADPEGDASKRAPGRRVTAKNKVFGDEKEGAVDHRDVAARSGSADFLTIVAALAAVRPEAVRALIEAGSETYKVRFPGLFYKAPSGNTIPCPAVVVDRAFWQATSSPTIAVGFDGIARGPGGKERKLWPFLLEKAWAAHHGGYAEIADDKVTRKSIGMALTGFPAREVYSRQNPAYGRLEYDAHRFGSRFDTIGDAQTLRQALKDHHLQRRLPVCFRMDKGAAPSPLEAPRRRLVAVTDFCFEDSTVTLYEPVTGKTEEGVVVDDRLCASIYSILFLWDLPETQAVAETDAAFTHHFNQAFADILDDFRRNLRTPLPALFSTGQRKKLWQYFMNRAVPRGLFPPESSTGKLGDAQRLLLAGHILLKGKLAVSGKLGKFEVKSDIEGVQAIWTYAGLNPRRSSGKSPTGEIYFGLRTAVAQPVDWRLLSDSYLVPGDWIVVSAPERRFFDWQSFNLPTPNAQNYLFMGWSDRLRTVKGRHVRDAIVLSWTPERGVVKETLAVTSPAPEPVPDTLRAIVTIYRSQAVEKPPETEEQRIFPYQPELTLLPELDEPVHNLWTGDEKKKAEKKTLKAAAARKAVTEALQETLNFIVEKGLNPKALAVALHAEILRRLPAPVDQVMTQSQIEAFKKLAQKSERPEHPSLYDLARLIAILQILSFEPVTYKLDTPLLKKLALTSRRDEDGAKAFGKIELETIQTDAFAAGFRAEFAEILKHFFYEERKADPSFEVTSAALSACFTSEQRKQILQFIQDRIIPPYLFIGMTREELAQTKLTVGQRALVAAHILSHGKIRGKARKTGAWVVDKPRADFCGHWVNWVWNYAAIHSGTTPSYVTRAPTGKYNVRGATGMLTFGSTLPMTHVGQSAADNEHTMSRSGDHEKAWDRWYWQLEHPDEIEDLKNGEKFIPNKPSKDLGFKYDKDGHLIPQEKPPERLLPLHLKGFADVREALQIGDWVVIYNGNESGHHSIMFGGWEEKGGRWLARVFDQGTPGSFGEDDGHGARTFSGPQSASRIVGIYRIDEKKHGKPLPCRDLKTIFYKFDLDFDASWLTGEPADAKLTGAVTTMEAEHADAQTAAAAASQEERKAKGAEAVKAAKENARVAKKRLESLSVSLKAAKEAVSEDAKKRSARHALALRRKTDVLAGIEAMKKVYPKGQTFRVHDLWTLLHKKATELVEAKLDANPAMPKLVDFQQTLLREVVDENEPSLPSTDTSAEPSPEAVVSLCKLAAVIELLADANSDPDKRGYLRHGERLVPQGSVLGIVKRYDWDTPKGVPVSELRAPQSSRGTAFEEPATASGG